MKNVIQNSNFILYLLVVIFSGLNCTHYPPLQQPDIVGFDNKVDGSLLADSLKAGKLSVGMPYYIVSEIFKDWPDNLKTTKIPVASLGSKQQLEEIEGWGRVYVDPGIQVFMDEFKTEKGKLDIWYQYPNFYRMDVSSGDTLVIILPDTTYSSVITDLKKANVLSTVNSFINLPRNKNLYAEIHYHDHPWRKVSYWYSIRVLSNGNTFLLKDLQYEIYPVELIEFNGTPVKSFKWR